MRFTFPLALLLLLLLPVVVALGWPARGYGRRREIFSLALRLLLLLCLVLSLAGIEMRQSSDRLAVVFLIDVSDSMPESAQALATAYVGQALQAMKADDQAAVIVFGADALVEQAMAHFQQLDNIISIPATNQTDLEEAIRLAMALYPPGAARRLVILSDGAVTTGNPADAARLAAAAGVEIVALPFLVTPGKEVIVNAVEAPTHLTQGERFNLNLTLSATQATSTVVRVLSAGQVIFEASYNVDTGEQTLSLPLVAGEPGFASYEVQVVPQDDTYYQNNELAAFAQVQGPPQILIIAPPAGEPLGTSGEVRPDEFTPIQNALQAAGFVTQLLRPSQLPSELPALAQYAAILLVDVPARQLNNRQMEALQSYVRDLGGGLVTVGGPTSYGVGGYYRTPLEETLPVEMQIKDQQRRPTLAIVFIIDHSGSMSETSGGVNKLDLAKEAAIRSVELLAPTDRVGVIAFDDVAKWVVEMTTLEDTQAVMNAIGSIQIGGGTDILAGLQSMAAVFPDDPSTVKHVILLTDGGADPSGIPELVERLYLEHNITLTTVGVGRDAAPFLPQLAELGGGRYHFAEDPGAIPSIFTEETTLATRAYIVEETFYPQLISTSPILNGIGETPPLYGYVGTSAKDAAQTILVSHLGDPILAAWQYGLGKAVSFTSDATGRWAQAWILWEGFPTLWSQAVRYVLSEQSFSPIELRVIHEEESARLVVDAAEHAPNGEITYLNGYSLQANIIDPAGDVTSIPLQQTAPGAYEASFIPSRQGAYLIRLIGQPVNPTQSPVAETAGWVLSYSPEYRRFDPDPDALLRLALAHGGRLASDDPAEAFSHTLSASQSYLPLWPQLLTLAALLLPFDIAARRLVITRSDLSHLAQRLRQRLARPMRTASPVQPGESTQPASQIDSLLQARQRTRKARSEVREAAPPRPTEAKGSDIQPPRPSPATQPPPLPPRPPADVQPEEQPQPSKPASSSTTSQLLARKRARKQERQD
ncbi:MAG: VWA domain-containing protein [Anaerolineales bacterium]|nr:VWA domain-containing protein [Anaerolineales bacterium]